MADTYRDNRFATNFSPLGLSMAIIMPVFHQQDDNDLDEQPQKMPVGYAATLEKSNQ